MSAEVEPTVRSVPVLFDRSAVGMTCCDCLMHPLEIAGLRKLRRLLIAHARGDVLEIGSGTGSNLAFYGRDCRIIAIDLEEKALRIARDRATTAHQSVRFVQTDAHQLCFSSSKFDTVVVTLVLCSVAHPRTVLEEIRRVLKPGGQLLLIEHVRSYARGVGYLQDWLTPAWCKLTNGCHLNRNTAQDILATGFLPIYTRTILMGLLMFSLYHV